MRLFMGGSVWEAGRRVGFVREAPAREGEKTVYHPLGERVGQVRQVPRGTRLMLMIFSLSLSGCMTPEKAVTEVNQEAYQIIKEKELGVRGKLFKYQVEPPQGRLAARWTDPTTGQVKNRKQALKLNLARAMELAALNSRSFQDQRERLYRAALDLMRQREDFRNTPSGLFSSNVTDGADITTVSGNSQFGVTRMLERGGTLALNLGLNFLKVVSSPTNKTVNSLLNLSISLPFLRNAGREIVYENLKQADRDVLYAMRDFERFKQTYGTQVMSAYLRLLVQVQQIQNEEANVKSLEFARLRNEAQNLEGRISRVQVDQALQSELQGRNRLVLVKERLEASLDSFKDLIGIPVDIKLEVDMGDLKRMQTGISSMDEMDVFDLASTALKARLDLRNVVGGVADAGRRLVVAKNQLQPTLTLNLSGSATSLNLKPLKYNFANATYSAGLDFDPGLDLDLESISLRRAMIDLQQALRNQEDFVEQVKLEVQNSWRQLQQRRDTYKISSQAVKLAEKRVESTRDFLEAGRASTRDFLESQDALISNQNQLVTDLVEYNIAFLELLRDTGVLTVSPEGLNLDLSIEQLTAK